MITYHRLRAKMNARGEILIITFIKYNKAYQNIITYKHDFQTVSGICIWFLPHIYPTLAKSFLNPYSYYDNRSILTVKCILCIILCLD